ncbi:reverse transcriptase domain-containing protein [Tanacetum coccineum]
MHKKSDFQWTPEAEEAFKQMKKLITELPTLTAPREHEELIIYLAAAKEAISAVLMTDREGKQIPVYFVSRTLRGPEVNYTPMEKLVLACSVQANDGYGAGLILKNPEGAEFTYAMRREKGASSNTRSKKQEKDGKILQLKLRVRGTSFKPGDMVYRSNEASHVRDEGKLGPKWEGPYEVKESLGKGAYKLKDCKGKWGKCRDM